MVEAVNMYPASLPLPTYLRPGVQAKMTSTKLRDFVLPPPYPQTKSINDVATVREWNGLLFRLCGRHISAPSILHERRDSPQFIRMGEGTPSTMSLPLALLRLVPCSSVAPPVQHFMYKTRLKGGPQVA